MTTLTERVRDLLPGWMRTDKPHIGRVVAGLGAALEAARTSMYSVRRAWFVKTAPEWALQLHAEALRMPRLGDEALEQWRSRLLSAWELYRSGGTRVGMERALEQVVGVTPVITELVFHPGPKLGPGLTIGHGWVLAETRWSEFEVDLGSMGTSHTTQVQAHATIERMKPAHTKLAALYADIPAVESSLGLYTTSEHSAERGDTPVIGGWTLGDGTVLGPNWSPL